MSIDRQRLDDIRRALEGAQDESQRQYELLGEKIDRSLSRTDGGPWPELADYQAWARARAEIERLSDEFEAALRSART